MTVNDTLPWINTLLIAAGFLFTYSMGTRRRTSMSEREVATIKLQVETMWAAFLASGIVKGITKGNLEMNSPVRLVGNSAKLMEGLRSQLEEFKNKECQGCDEKELALQVANKFKEQIIEISVLNDWPFELGLIIATAIANGKHTLSEILDEHHITMSVQAIEAMAEKTAAAKEKVKEAAEATVAAAEATVDAAKAAHK